MKSVLDLDSWVCSLYHEKPLCLYRTFSGPLLTLFIKLYVTCNAKKKTFTDTSINQLIYSTHVLAGCAHKKPFPNLHCPVLKLVSIFFVMSLSWTYHGQLIFMFFVAHNGQCSCACLSMYDIHCTYI